VSHQERTALIEQLKALMPPRTLSSATQVVTMDAWTLEQILVALQGDPPAAPECPMCTPGVRRDGTATASSNSFVCECGTRIPKAPPPAVSVGEREQEKKS
jgi:hypothetical protein